MAALALAPLLGAGEAERHSALSQNPAAEQKLDPQSIRLAPAHDQRHSPPPPTAPVVFERGSALFGRINPGAPMEMLCDSSQFEAIERDGIHYFVLLKWDEQRTWLKILECSGDGSIRKTHTVLDDNLKDATAIQSLQFLPDGRLLAVLHVSPTNSIAIAIDFADSTFVAMSGTDFTPDPTGRHIAYLVAPADDGEHPSPVEVWLDGRKLADLPAIEGATLSWDASGSRVIAAVSEPGLAPSTLKFEAWPSSALTRR